MLELVFGSIFLIVNMLCLLSANYYEKTIIDNVFVTLKWNALFQVLCIYGLVSCIGLVSGLLGPYILIKIQTKLRLEMYDKLLRSIYKLPTEIFLSQKIGKYLSNFNYDVVMASLIYIYSIPELILQLFSTIIILGILFVINKWVFIFALIWSLTYVFLQQLFGKKVKEVNKEIAIGKSDITICIEEGISATREIVSWNRYNWATDRLRKMYDKYLQSINKEIKVTNKSVLFGDAIEWLPKVTVLIVGGYAVFKGDYSVGMIYLMYQYISKVMKSSNELFATLIKIRKYVVSLERLEKIFSSNSHDTRIKLLNGKINKIHFNDIHFRFPGCDENVLRGLTFEFLIGKTNGLVGLSGGGKSTIIQLIAGFYQPSQGDIYINDIPLSSLKKSQLNQRMAIVFQDPYFFADSIEENIIMGRRNIDKKKLIEVCKIVEIFDFIQELPFKFNTLLGERGINLSGGQRQRIALARALIGEPEILILDESTSALDVKTESNIMNNIKKARFNQTTIVIAHRLSTIESAENIIILDKGKVSDEGTHEQLLITSDIYQNLVNKQITNIKIAE
ncbi:ABC transporter ATP-binding protein [Oceanirhabdus sp. W0125-5]|uniref:ABC transporter ATP-binding protein n=1 Tax=Oceanirhabdus sp. W0125-5 TaxID=2999116 RepID=UPI0022F2B7B9|nr:ABC transporter ATP-binding protein [Oceanirhabdus sp. W0125-5]WBW97042.1 ABC transporter ATP-binding protein [Oceanirhabdus sp. W0125-5]